MSHELICSWLGLQSGDWPPDHYRLLGLEPGEQSAELIEQRVHQRLDMVRRYQMIHPEQATEAMNRLAQAFVCLSEPLSKKLYDAELLGSSRHEAASGVAADPLAWLYTPNAQGAPNGTSTATLPPPLPPPLPLEHTNQEPPPIPTESTAPVETVTVPPLPVAPPAEPIDPAVEAALSAPARRGLSSKRALFYRVARTRQLLRVWDQVGAFLGAPRRRPARSSQVLNLLRQLAEVRQLLDDFPPLMGEAGQPGYLILALDELGDTQAFQTLSGHQREALSRDWKAAHKLLIAHRNFLRQEIRAQRRRPLKERMRRRLRAALVEEPAAMLLLLALLAINIAVWRTYAGPLLNRLSVPWHSSQPAGNGNH
jgi:hypothetical protein